MVGIEQPGIASDDAVAVGVGVVGERDVETVLERGISPAIASGEEQSMRILPSWSSGMNANVGSIGSLTTSRSSG